MTQEDLLKEIEQLLQSGELAENTELSNIFLQAKESAALAELTWKSQLSQSLSLYLLTHQFRAPRQVLQLAQSIAKSPHQQRGKGAFLQMLAQSLIRCIPRE